MSHPRSSESSRRRAVAVAACATVGALALLAAAVTPARAQTYDAVADFSVSNGNPNGVWQYGRATTLGGDLTLFTTVFSEPLYQNWNYEGGPFSLPAVGKDRSGLETRDAGTVRLTSDTLQLHPGQAPDAFSVVRFIAPVGTAGAFTIAGNFQALDATTTDVHVFLNGVSQFTDTVTSAVTNPAAGTSARFFNLSRTLQAGDRVDFVVGNGGNGYFNDSTGFKATITASSASAPEPGSAVLALCGLAPLAGAVVARRRRAL